MRILLTGYTGFLGENIFNGIYKDFDVLPTRSSTLDLTDKKAVNRFFRKNGYFDAVIHCSVKSAFREEKINIDNYLSNVSMVTNLIENKDNYGILINFCSGAAFDREGGVIANVKEEELPRRHPKDYYGSAKNNIARMISEINMYSLRIFGCFNYNEKPQRFISTCISKCKNKEDIIISQDRFFDFFYAEDVVTVVKKVLSDHPLFYKDINLCYNKKQLLSQIAKTVKSSMNSEVDIKIQSPYMGNCYTGSSEKLDILGLDLIGLEAGIQRQIEKS
tara:strand:+ start:380 stop:1207 length:828 start_codon:yes stop_codon:yes gene_type:complete